MENDELINVLWVEDDPDIIVTFKVVASNFGLKLTPYSCWDDAKEALSQNFGDWSAIILDARCKYHRDSPDSAIVFLREALKDISKIEEKKKQYIPWYVFSAGDEYEINDLINDERLNWDADWGKKYYSKNIDDEVLCNRIKECVQNNSPKIQIHKIYEEVFGSIRKLGISENVIPELESLLIPIHFLDAVDDDNYNNRFISVRLVMEYIIRSMSKHGILPKFSEEVNLRGSIALLGPGINKEKIAFADIDNNKYQRTTSDSILPDILFSRMKEMARVVAREKAHSKSDKGDIGKNKRNHEASNYLQTVGYSTYLLKSYALNLCDLIIWYRNYLRIHPDFEENAKNWEVVERQQ